MREIKIDDVREGDVARSNGKELRVVGASPTGRLIRCEGGDQYTFRWTHETLAALGVTFWREERALPIYSGAIVASRDRLRFAVRSCAWSEHLAQWLTTDQGHQWRHDPELLEWLGPDWEEMATPPAREWVPVDFDQIRDGDFARVEWQGAAVEGVAAVDGHEIEFKLSVIHAKHGKWFKRKEQGE